MQLKKFEAPNIHEAFKKIKAELGDNAVIFSSKTIKAQSDLPHQKNRPWVEVTAAVDRENNKKLQIVSDNSMLEDNYLENLKMNDNHIAQNINDYLQSCGNTQLSSRETMKSFSSTLLPYLKNLLWSGFKQDIACYLLGEVTAEYAHDTKKHSIYPMLMQKIACHLPVNGPIQVSEQQKKIVAFIGPTGVGKTTTLAKIAAHYAFTKGMKVKIITMDTYRIAAVEQLRVYGKIMDLPVVIAASVDELEREIKTQNGYNLMLIDTAGRNHRDNGKMVELTTWLKKYKEIETHLLISATTSENIINSIIQCFGKSKIDNIIITKVDECARLGHLYNIFMAHEIPISYITTGQRVPEDIKPASGRMLARIFLNGFDN